MAKTTPINNGRTINTSQYVAARPLHTCVAHISYLSALLVRIPDTIVLFQDIECPIRLRYGCLLSLLFFRSRI